MPAAPRFEDLYTEFLPRIYGYILSHLRNGAEAEDVTSQVFIKAYTAYERFEPRADTPAAWLFRIARNAVYDQHRRTGVRERVERQVGASLEVGEDPSRVAEDRIAGRDLWAAVGRLPDRQREAVSLRIQSDLGFKEIGDLMGCSEDAAKMLYHRALRALRGEVEA